MIVVSPEKFPPLLDDKTTNDLQKKFKNEEKEKKVEWGENQS